MGAIHVGQIEVVGIQGITEILDVEICAKRNKHAFVFIKGVIDEKECEKFFLRPLEGRKISLQTGDAKEDVIFCGVIHKIRIFPKKEGNVIEIYGISASVYFDGKRKSRSFQAKDCTWQHIVNEVIRDTENAAVIFQTPDEIIQEPAIQYEETDWEFILRLASRYHIPVYVDFYSGKPWIYCGLPEYKIKNEMDIITHSWGVSENYPFRTIRTYWQCRIGERISGYNNWSIQELECRLYKGLLEYKCILRPNEYLFIQPIYNKRLKGTFLKGKVINVQNECVRLWLTIDEQCPVEDTFWYQWQPETGNMFYCMPEMGAEVYLYISGKTEKTAVAVGCIHEKYKGCQDRVNPENRSIVLGSQKKMELLPEGLCISNQKEERLEINLGDKNGVQIDSFGEVTLIAGEKIGIKGNKIFFQAAEETAIIRKSMLQPTVINMGNQFDVVGRYAEVTAGGEPMMMLPVINSGMENDYSLKHIEGAVLASTPIDGSFMENEIVQLSVGSKVHRMEKGERGERVLWENLKK